MKTKILKLGLPKGSLQEATFRMFRKAGFNISVSDLISNKKKRVFSYPRQMAMYLARKYTNASFKEIGDSFGPKDHSTVIYAIRRIERFKDQKKEIMDDLNKIENLLT